MEFFKAFGTPGTQWFKTTFDKSGDVTVNVKITIPVIVGCMDPGYLEYNSLANQSNPGMLYYEDC